MNYSLDTHTFFWWATESTKLGTQALSAIESEESVVYVSVIVLWEIIIKYQIGKMQLADEPTRFFTQQCEQHGFIVLSVDSSHVSEVAALPLIHRDPFDRILIAQARTDNLTLITGDPLIRQYEVTTLW